MCRQAAFVVIAICAVSPGAAAADSKATNGLAAPTQSQTRTGTAGTDGSPLSGDQARLPDSAFMLNLQFGGAAPVYLIGVTGAFSPSVFPSLVVGYRLLGWLELGVGINFTRFQSATVAALGGTSSSSSSTIITFAPTGMFDMVKAADKRVALYGKFALPLGPLVSTTTGAESKTGVAVAFDAGIGTRYAVHRMLAVAIEAGFTGAFYNFPQSANTGVMAVYGALAATFYAPK